MKPRLSIRPLTAEELFHLTADGLLEISDETLSARLDAAEREALKRGYDAAAAEEMLQSPEAV